MNLLNPETSAGRNVKYEPLKRSFINVRNFSNDVHQRVCIMQWNILAQALTDDKPRCPNDALVWEYRKHKLLEEIRSVNPDILCLQEVDYFDFFKSTLEPCGYDGTFMMKPNSPTLVKLINNGPDGCAIFIKRSVLELVNSKSVVIEVDNKTTNQVAIACKVRLLSGDHEFGIICTHLKAKDSWEKYRYSQGKFLLEFLEKNFAELPLIICGDFNAAPEEPLIKLFNTHGLQLESAYSLLKSPNCSLSHIPYSTAKWSKTESGEKKIEKVIDYIWYTKLHFKVENILSIPTIAEIGCDLLPSYCYPSDHLSLAAILALKN